MQLTKGAIGNLINRYKAVLKKCHLMNTFGSLAVAGMLVMGGAGVAVAADAITTGQDFQNAVTNAKSGDTITLGQDIKEGLGAVFKDKTVTVDFGGHTYTGYSGSVGSTGTETALFQLLKDSPTVTLKNGILNIATPTAASGKFKRVLQNYCNLTLDNMIVDGTNLLGDGPYTMSNNHGDITINNSAIIAKEGGVAFDVYYWPDGGYGDGVSVTVNNSTINGKIEVTVDGKYALEDGAKHQLTLTGGTLTGGLTAAQGAQLYNEGTTVISDVAMAGNIATEKGGAIFNSDDKTGAKGNLTLNNVDLKDNKANFGGAIWNEGTLTVTGGSFEGNTATKAAGAIYNAADAKLTVDGVTFANNSSAKAGAINSMAGKNETTTTIKNSKFNNNSAVNGMGGALANSSNAENGSTEGFSGKMSLTDTAFSGNTARNGGALWNGVQWTVNITGGSFDNNSAVTPAGSTYPAQGGAISNSGALNISGVTFSNNKTDGLGGAIFNTKTGGGAGSITFNGTNTFTNNTAASKANDIYNAGTITVAGGTTTLNSGLILAENGKVEVTGGTLDMASGSTLDMGNGTLTINGGTFVADAGLLINNGATDGSYAANDANKVTDSSIVGTQGNLNLRWFDGDYTLGEYTSVKNALLNPSSEKAELTLLNAQLAVEDGKTLVTGAVPSDGTATLATGAKVVNNDSTNVAGGTDVPHTPENYVSVVDKTDADRLLEVSTIGTNGNSITAKGLKIAGAAGADAVTLKVTPTGGNNSTLTLVGDSKADTGVIDKDGKALATKAEVATNNTLNMGLTGNTQDQGLTLTEATVTGTLNANGGVTGTTSEYAINALTMQTNSQVNVLNSTMQIGQFTAAGGTMFVDPAYVKIDSVTGPTFGTKLLVGTGSTVNIGGMSEADMRQAMEKAGMSVGPNFTVGANQSVLVLGQALTLGTSGKIVVDAGVDDSGSISGTPVSDDAYFGRDSLLVVNGNTLNGATAAINLSGATTKTLNVENGAKLLITDAVDGTTYTIIDGETNTSTAFNSGAYADGTGWNGDNLLTSSDMVTLTSDDGTMFKAKSEDAHTVFPNLSHELATAVNNLYTGKLNNVDSDQMGVRFLSRATDNRFLGADKDAAASTIESAARMAFAGAVPQMTKMASDAGTNAVVNRLGFANPADGAQAMDAEGKIVDRNTTGFALWIAPLWQSQHGWGMEADNMDYGFNGNLGGVSLGADYTFENAIRAGITFNIGGGYAESSGGDLSSTENRMNFWGLGAYAGWNYENFGLMADISYTSTWNDLKQDVDSRMGMGDLEADVQASAISAGLRAEYKLETSVLDVIPHIGVRYMSLNTWGFDAESNGGTVLEGDGFHQDIWTFPVGVTFTKDFTLDSGWSFKPSIDFSVIPAAGDIKAKQDVAFTGLPGTYEVETQMMDYLTWQGGVGLEMGNDTMSFGVNYTLQAGQHTTSHGVFGSFRYEF
jgi:hypothetical protein